MTEAVSALSWSEFQWEEWVPLDVRSQVMRFWSDERPTYRSPKAWAENAKQNNAPKMGQRVRCQTLSREWDEGRYVHAWNNIGRLVHEDGTFSYVGCQPFECLDPDEAIALVNEVIADHEARGIRAIRLSDWFTLGEEKFGGDQDDWVFKCPSCGHIQSVNSIKKIQRSRSLEVSESSKIWMWITQSCAGRKIPGVGCDWTLRGLFQIHKMVVVTERGGVDPVFEFAEVDSENQETP